MGSNGPCHDHIEELHKDAAPLETPIRTASAFKKLWESDDPTEKIVAALLDAVSGVARQVRARYPIGVAGQTYSPGCLRNEQLSTAKLRNYGAHLAIPSAG